MGKSYQITEAELKALEELRTQNKDKGNYSEPPLLH